MTLQNIFEVANALVIAFLLFSILICKPSFLNWKPQKIQFHVNWHTVRFWRLGKTSFTILRCKISFCEKVLCRNRILCTLTLSLDTKILRSFSFYAKYTYLVENAICIKLQLRLRYAFKKHTTFAYISNNS